MYASLVLEDIAWLDVSRIHEDPVAKPNSDKAAAQLDINGKQEEYDQMGEGSSKSRFSGYVKVFTSSFMVVDRVLDST